MTALPPIACLLAGLDAPVYEAFVEDRAPAGPAEGFPELLSALSPAASQGDVSPGLARPAVAAPGPVDASPISGRDGLFQFLNSLASAEEGPFPVVESPGSDGAPSSSRKAPRTDAGNASALQLPVFIPAMQLTGREATIPIAPVSALIQALAPQPAGAAPPSETGEQLLPVNPQPPDGGGEMTPLRSIEPWGGSAWTAGLAASLPQDSPSSESKLADSGRSAIGAKEAASPVPLQDVAGDLSPLPTAILASRSQAVSGGKAPPPFRRDGRSEEQPAADMSKQNGPSRVSIPLAVVAAAFVPPPATDRVEAQATESAAPGVDDSDTRGAPTAGIGSSMDRVRPSYAAAPSVEDPGTFERGMDRVRPSYDATPSVDDLGAFGGGIGSSMDRVRPSYDAAPSVEDPGTFGGGIGSSMDRVRPSYAAAPSVDDPGTFEGGIASSMDRVRPSYAAAPSVDDRGAFAGVPVGIGPPMERAATDGRPPREDAGLASPALPAAGPDDWIRPGQGSDSAAPADREPSPLSSRTTPDSRAGRFIPETLVVPPVARVAAPGPATPPAAAPTLPDATPAAGPAFAAPAPIPAPATAKTDAQGAGTAPGRMQLAFGARLVAAQDGPQRITAASATPGSERQETTEEKPAAAGKGRAQRADFDDAVEAVAPGERREVGTAISGSGGAVSGARNLERPADSRPPEAPRAERAAPLPEDPKAPPAARDIKLELAGADRKIEVRLVERAGDVRFTVRTPDDRLAGVLREELPSLSSRLAESGFHAEDWRAAAPGAAERRLDVPTASASANDDRPSGRRDGDGQQRRENEPRQQPDQPEEDNNRKGASFAWLMESLPRGR